MLKKAVIRVYVAGPYSAASVLGVFTNIERGLAASGAFLRAGFAVFSPWVDSQFFTSGQAHGVSVSDIKAHSMAWLEVSDIMVAIPGWQESSGTREEIARAEHLGIPVFKVESTMELHGLIVRLNERFDMLPELHPHFNNTFGLQRAILVKKVLTTNGPLFEMGGQG